MPRSLVMPLVLPFLCKGITNPVDQLSGK